MLLGTRQSLCVQLWPKHDSWGQDQTSSSTADWKTHHWSRFVLKLKRESQMVSSQLENSSEIIKIFCPSSIRVRWMKKYTFSFILLQCIQSFLTCSAIRKTYQTELKCLNWHLLFNFWTTFITISIRGSCKNQFKDLVIHKPKSMIRIGNRYCM